MKRQDKYPDTATFHYHNANPKGRITGDCRMRAISVACEVPYNQVVMDFARIQCETGYDQTASQGISILLKEYGWVKQKQPRKDDGTKYSGKEFCEMLQDDPWLFTGKENDYNARIIANIGGHHIVAIVAGQVWDIWNSTGGCIGNYWTKGSGA